MQVDQSTKEDENIGKGLNQRAGRGARFARVKRPDLDIGLASQGDDISSMKDKMQVGEELASGLISEAPTKITNEQSTSMRLDGQSQRSARVHRRQMPDKLFGAPGDIAKPMETSSQAKPMYQDQNSLAAPNEYKSMVVGGRGH